MAELFARDPGKYTEQDLDAIIEHYRKMRQQFNVVGPRATTAKAKKEKVDPATVELDLGDLTL
jgi:hypothetical protein